MPYYRKKTATTKRRPYAKKRKTYKKKNTYKSKKNAFNKTNDMYVPKKKLCTLINHSLPGSDITNLSVLNDRYGAPTTSAYGAQWGILTTHPNLNTTTASCNAKWSKFTSFYEKVCLIGSKITVQYTNTGTSPIKIICGINDNSITRIEETGTDLYNAYQNVKGHKTFSLLPDTSRMQYKVSFKCNPNKLTGLMKPLSDSTLIPVSDPQRQETYYYLNRPYYPLGYYKNLTGEEEPNNWVGNGFNIDPDNLVHYYHSAIDMKTGAISTAFKVDYVLENTYIFTDTIDQGIN